jgi:hypothetical protein
MMMAAVKKAPTAAQVKTPAKSVIAKAIAQKEAARANAREAAAKGSNVVVHPSGGVARGAAVATSFFNSLKTEGQSLRRYFTDIANMSGDSDALKAYRRTLGDLKKGDTDVTDPTLKLTRSHFVRISESIQVCRAAQRGMKMDDVVSSWNERGIGKQMTADTIPFSYIPQYARKWITAHNEDGGAIAAAEGQSGAGRKQLTPEEKVRNYILRNFAFADLKAVRITVDSLVESVKSAKQFETLKHPEKEGEKAPAAAPAKKSAKK